MDQENQDDLYRIGTVASLTGLSVERLRAWERRYDLSPAFKSGKTRFYSRDQLAQLKLIKHLIDQGQPISSLAGLSQEQLEQRVREQPVAQTLVALQAPQVGLVGPNLLILEQQVSRTGQRQRIDVVSRWANMEAFRNEQTGTEAPTVLVLQLPVLSSQDIDKAKDFYPEATVVAVYQFATAQMISQVQASGTPTMKWPVSWDEIEHVALTEGTTRGRAGQMTPRRFSDEELIAIAATDEDATQCPSHLVEAIQQLNALASYTRQCQPEADREATFAQVRADTAAARAQLEMALETLLSDDTDDAAAHAPQDLRKHVDL